MTTMATQRRDALDERLIGYHGKGLDHVVELLDYLREPGDAMIAGGSLSIGLGNRLSDVDVVLVGPTTRTSTVPLQHWIDRLRIDVWTRSTENVDDLFGEAEASLASPAPLLRVFGNTEQEQQLKLLHRITFGVLVEGDAVNPSGSRDPEAVAIDLLTREYAERLRESATVGRLALACGRLQTAAFSARQGLEEALHAVLHAGGVPFSGDKWLQEQLRGYPQLQALHAEFLDVPRRSTPAALVERYVDEAFGHASTLLGVPLNQAAVTAELEWKAGELALLPLAGDHILVHAESGSAWSLSDAEAQWWTALAASRTEAGTMPHPGDSADAAAFCLRLHEQGVLTPTWERGVPLSALTIDPEVLR